MWLFDLGHAAKVRPVLVISIPYGDDDRALNTIIPHTTSARGSTHEVRVDVPFLKSGAFLVQGVATYPASAKIRKLGELRPELFALVMKGLARWLGQMPN